VVDILGAVAVVDWLAAAWLISHAVALFLLVRSTRLPATEPSQITIATRITIQIPAYNEKFVIGRCMAAVARLRYPAELLEVQVLDDSNDETSAIIAECATRLRALGIDCYQLRRTNRTGYKAGALAAGLARARGELIAIFDADFVPSPDFLLRAVRHFGDPYIGAVQGRWSHLNSTRSMVTKLDAILVDTQLGLIQRGRSAHGLFVAFVGSGGVWRRNAIEDAGGWNLNGVAEDLDLSYRAQLRGWRIVYDDALVALAELPEDLNTLRAQRFRWVRTAALTARQILPAVASSPIRYHLKVASILHLLEPITPLASFTLLSCSVFAGVFAGASNTALWIVFNPAPLCAFGLIASIYYQAYSGSSKSVFAFYCTALFLLTWGLVVHDSLAAAAGLAGRSSGFDRTPKRGSMGDAVKRLDVPYRPHTAVRPRLSEFMVWAGLLAALEIARARGHLELLWLPAIAFVGLTAVLAKCLFEAR
jgi:cellulose synthase/poly-beta-1,6-N-acetylglucosamine synthase-like glycosyltransferase